MARKREPTELEATVSKQLKALRESAGLSQEKLARAVDVSSRTVQNWEKGGGTFPFTDAIKIADALGCTLYDLAGLAEPPAAKRKGGGAK
jgi:transcriptional regulator with XRE-family HTH domain